MKERERTILQYDIQHWAKKLGHFYYIGTRYIISSMVLDKLRMMINYRSKGVQKLHSAVEVVVYMVWCENKEWRLLWNFEYYIFSSINQKNTSWTHLPTILKELFFFFLEWHIYMYQTNKILKVYFVRKCTFFASVSSSSRSFIGEDCIRRRAKVASSRRIDISITLGEEMRSSLALLPTKNEAGVWTEK